MTTGKKTRRVLAATAVVMTFSAADIVTAHPASAHAASTAASTSHHTVAAKDAACATLIRVKLVGKNGGGGCGSGKVLFA